MVKVGAATETEMKEKKHRVEDALQATRAALEEGVVPGGGVALLNAQAGLDPDKLDDADENTGARIIHRSLEEPVRQIAENSGEEGSVVVNKVRDLKTGEGLNAATGEYGDLIKAGVIDPTMVTRSALAERRVDRQEHPRHRGDHRRAARGGRRRWRYARRHAGHGRHDVTRPRDEWFSKGPANAGPFFCLPREGRDQAGTSCAPPARPAPSRCSHGRRRTRNPPG